VSEYDDSVGDLLAQSFSFPVASGTIPVAGGVTIGTGLGGHNARFNTFRDCDLVPRHGQDKTHVEGQRGEADGVNRIRGLGCVEEGFSEVDLAHGFVTGLRASPK
jgi:hypothetical protein